ncbi:respiratory nitrate reductase subunit gamma [Sulfuriflexus mobilis]|uniref:respiratory nitrate reductase subunit gamma n=1 Tax=Sulfuriflexus mobilis TaxID=1811807 RepID=UPI000F848CD3|nr:respiratory nitrate reductase subunit gamma [Sulfuriflexus mobilis]
MSVTLAYSILFYVATVTLVAGLAYRIYTYAKTPAPLKIATTPAPTTRAGVAYRLAREVVLFESLFKATKWTWLFGWAFHFGMLLVLLRHLRYFTDTPWFWVNLIQPFGIYAGFVMLLGLFGLWARRFLVDRVRYISSPSDHLMLLLLIGIAASGLLMKFVSHTDIVGVKNFAIGLMEFNFQPMPESPILMVHLGLVAVLMIIFPFSKLLHAAGVFFSPTRNQVDNPREVRHVADWAKDAE